MTIIKKKALPSLYLPPLKHQPLTPATHSPTSSANRVTVDIDVDAAGSTRNVSGWCKKRDRQGGLRHEGVAPVPLPVPGSAPFVAVHTLENTRGYFGNTAAAAAAAVADVSKRRPHTSSGCGRRPKPASLDSLGARGENNAGPTRKEVQSPAALRAGGSWFPDEVP